MVVIKLACFLAVVASASALSIGALVGLDKDGLDVNAKVGLPKIPLLTAPLLWDAPEKPNEIAERLTNAPREAYNPAMDRLFFYNPYNQYYPDMTAFIPLPNVTAILSKYGNMTNVTVVQVPLITPLPPLGQGHFFHLGLGWCLNRARSNLAQSLNAGVDISTGLQIAIQQAILSDDRVNRVNAIYQSILNAYSSAIRQCPYTSYSSRISTEAARLVNDVTRAINNLIVQ